jgi:2OG-Fe(II) oxygenase superfamily
MSSTIRDAAVSLWAHWINQPYLSESAISSIRESFQARPRRPLILKNFLTPHKAECLAKSFEQIGSWTQTHSVLNENKQLITIDSSEWEMLPVEERWSRQEIAAPLSQLLKDDGALDPTVRVTILHFVLFTITSPALRSWLASVVDVELDQRVSCELVRYGQGDFITEHSDTHDTRIIGVNFYLGESWKSDDGGRLGYRNERGQVFMVDPEFNSLSIIPIHHGCSHWVTPWKSSLLGRYTFCLSFRPAS